MTNIKLAIIVAIACSTAAAAGPSTIVGHAPPHR